MPTEATLPTKKRNLAGVLSGVAVLVAVVILGAWFAAHRSQASKADAQAPMSTMSGMGGPPAAASPAVGGPTAEPQIEFTPDDLKKLKFIWYKSSSVLSRQASEHPV